MVGYKKLALIAAVFAVGVAVEAPAAPMTEGAFVTYHSSRDSGSHWRRGAKFLMHFINWRDENPKWTVENISWVDRWAGDGGSLQAPDPSTLPPGWTVEEWERTPPWKRPAQIPEPGTAMLVVGLGSLVALRRRSM